MLSYLKLFINVYIIDFAYKKKRKGKNLHECMNNIIDSLLLNPDKQHKIGFNIMYII